MLIAIAGSQGVGKSTLISDLSSSFPVIERKTSRSILSDWEVTLDEVNSQPDLTQKFQNEILERKFQDEQVAREDPEQIWITERTYADLFTYALFAMGKFNKYDEWMNDYYQRCVNYQVQYQQIFFLTKATFAPVHDGVRGVNKFYSEAVDIIMLKYTQQMSDNITIINTSSRQERIDVIWDILKIDTEK